MSIKGSVTVNRNKLKCPNGISIKSDIAFSLNNKTASFFPIIQLTLTFIAAISVIYMIPSFLNWEGGSYYITNGLSLCMVVLLTAAANIFCAGKSGILKAIGIMYLCVNSVYIVTNIGKTVNGFMYTANVYTKRAGFAVPLFVQSAADASQDEIEMFLLVFAFLLTLVISFACIYHVNFPILFAATFPVFELGTFWGWEPYTWSTVLVISTWVIVLSLNLINHTTKKKDSQNTFAVYPRRRSYYLTSERIKASFFGLSSVAVVAVTALVFFIVFVFSSVTDNYRPKDFKKLRHDISTGFRDFSNDLSEGKVIGGSSLPGRGKMIGGTNGGKLGLYDKISYTGSTSLKIQTQKPDRALYLRGYSAENYSDNTWDPIKADENISDFFSSHGTTILDYDFIQHLYSGIGETERENIDIDPVNANKDVIYAPYGSLYSEHDSFEDQKYDGMVSPKKKEKNKSYKMNFIDIMPEYEWADAITNMSANNSGAYNEYAAYSDHVKNLDDYREMPRSLVPVLDEVILQSGIEGGDSLGTMQRKITDYFYSSGFEYTLEPGITPQDKDFVAYFLTEQKKGYCTYFASAGVMLMRKMGIPSRYVEGYIVQPEQFSDDTTAVLVSDRCAHAWCEVFVEGYGWYPLEFTLGYEDGNPNLTDRELNRITDDSSQEDENSGEEINSSAAESSSAAGSSQASHQQSSSDGSSSETAESSSATDKAAAADNGSGKGTPGVGKKADGGAKVSKTQAAYISITVLFIAFAAAVVIIRRKVTINRRLAAINDPDNSSAVIACYTELLKYCELLGVENSDSLTDIQLAAILSDKLGEISPELVSQFLSLSDSAICAYMSDTKATEAEGASSRTTFDTISRAIYDMLDSLSRFKAKWLMGLY